MIARLTLTATLVAFAKATMECSWKEEKTKETLVPKDLTEGKSTMVVDNAKFAIGLGKILYYGDGAEMKKTQGVIKEISDLQLVETKLYMIMEEKKVYNTSLDVLNPIPNDTVTDGTSLGKVEKNLVVANGKTININAVPKSTPNVAIAAVASDGTTVLGVGKEENTPKSAILTKKEDGKYNDAVIGTAVTHTGGLVVSGENVLAGDATEKSIMKANKALDTVSTLDDAAVKDENIHHLGGYDKMVFGLNKDGTKVVVSENYGNKGSWTAVETPKDDKKEKMKFEVLSVDPTKKAVYALVKKSATEYKVMKGECKVKKPSAAYSKALMGPLAISAVALFGAFL